MLNNLLHLFLSLICRWCCTLSAWLCNSSTGSWWPLGSASQPGGTSKNPPSNKPLWNRWSVPSPPCSCGLHPRPFSIPPHWAPRWGSANPWPPRRWRMTTPAVSMAMVRRTFTIPSPPVGRAPPIPPSSRPARSPGIRRPRRSPMRRCVKNGVWIGWWSSSGWSGRILASRLTARRCLLNRQFNRYVFCSWSKSGTIAFFSFQFFHNFFLYDSKNPCAIMTDLTFFTDSNYLKMQ